MKRTAQQDLDMANLRIAYEEAKERGETWDMEFSGDGVGWSDCLCFGVKEPPRWYSGVIYRRKPEPAKPFRAFVAIPYGMQPGDGIHQCTHNHPIDFVDGAPCKQGVILLADELDKLEEKAAMCDVLFDGVEKLDAVLRSPEVKKALNATLPF